MLLILFYTIPWAMYTQMSGVGLVDDSVVKLAFAERREPSVAMAVDDDDVWVGIAS